DSGKPVRIRDGRFGPYVTDGETNATVPRGTDVADVDFERAVQLLADKRAKGPVPKRGSAKKAPAKKAPAKKKSTSASRSEAAKKAAATRAANKAARAAEEG